MVTAHRVNFKDRDEFQTIFRYIADAIDPAHFDAMPVVMLSGISAKSLAVDTMLQAFDDIKAQQGLRDMPIPYSNKSQYESVPEEATYNPCYTEIISGGIARQFMFCSGVGLLKAMYGVNKENTLKSYHAHNPTSGMVFLSGNNAQAKETVDLCIDLDVHTDVIQISGSIGFEQIGTIFATCPRFNAYIKNFESAACGDDLCPPSPEVYKSPANYLSELSM